MRQLKCLVCVCFYWLDSIYFVFGNNNNDVQGFLWASFTSPRFIFSPPPLVWPWLWNLIVVGDWGCVSAPVFLEIPTLNWIYTWNSSGVQREQMAVCPKAVWNFIENLINYVIQMECSKSPSSLCLGDEIKITFFSPTNPSSLLTPLL